METVGYSKGVVEFVEFPASAGSLISLCLHSPELLQQVIRDHAIQRVEKGNLVFNFPREQYAKLDRGESPETVNANYLTLAATNYTNPATLTVTGEALRVAASAKAVDPTNSKNTILRFLLDVGQFVGTWSSAILIGGSAATLTVGTGKIVAAVNNVKDDTNAPLSRDGTTIHLVNWKLKHLDSSEV